MLWPEGSAEGLFTLRIKSLPLGWPFKAPGLFQPPLLFFVPCALLQSSTPENTLHLTLTVSLSKENLLLPPMGFQLIICYYLNNKFIIIIIIIIIIFLLEH